MRVVLDVTSALLPGSGVKTYVYLQAEALAKTAGVNDLALFPFVRALGQLDHRGSTQSGIATAVRLAAVRAANAWNLPLADFAARRADLFHISQHLARVPAGVRTTATLFDMSCWTAPETHTPANIEATKAYAERVLRRVDGVIAISESARDDAVRILSLSPDRIEVISPGVRAKFFHVSTEEVESVRRRYDLPQNYILTLGTVEPRKNLDRLMNAYTALPRDMRDAWPLIIAGPEGWKSAATIERLRSRAEGWRYLGYIPENDAPALTAGAAMFVFPSLYEGFGLPLAQAMAAGVPCISSNASSLPEVAGDAAILVDPRSEAELTAAMRRLIEYPGKRSELASRAKGRASRYTWLTSANRSWAFFKRVAG